MKQIVMLQGMGNNERGWARRVSAFGRVVMIQQGFIEHVEIWEQGRCTFCGPERSLIKTRFLDEITFSSLTMLRSLRCCWKHTSGEKLDLVIASNYSMGLAALLLRALGKSGKVVCWVSDYLPPRGSFGVRVHRRITGLLTRWAVRWADEAWAVSPRIPTAKANPRNFVVPLCIDDNGTPAGSRQEIGYIGFPSPDHALDVLFDIGRKHGFRINVIGDSPFLQSIKHLAPPGTVFHGITNDKTRIDQVFARCFCGYAVYRTTGAQSYSYYGIPSKTLYFFASNTPVVTTNTAHFTQNIEKYGLGRVVEPQPDNIEAAILQIKAQYPTFSHAIERFRDEWSRHVLDFHRERFAALGVLPNTV